MRKIKFRAWNGKRYDYEGFVIYPDGRFEYPEGGWDLQGFYDDGILEQFTGLHDKNGKEIYEGDIVRHDSLPGAQNGNPIVSDGCRFFVNCSLYSDTVFLAPSSGKYCEVIGNIHENPELLQ